MPYVQHHMHVCSLRCPCLDRARTLHSEMRSALGHRHAHISLPVSAVWTARAFFIQETRSALDTGWVTFSLPVSGPRAHSSSSCEASRPS